MSVPNPKKTLVAALKSGQFITQVIFATALWVLWNTRNAIVHERQGLVVRDIAAKVRVCSDEFIDNCSAKQSLISHAEYSTGHNDHWQVPAMGTYKLNVDAAHFQRKNEIGIGAIMRNCHGEPLICLSERVSVGVDPSFAELLAVKYALWRLRVEGHCDFAIELDSTVVVQALVSYDYSESRMGHFVREVKSLMCWLNVSHCQHVLCAGNSIAHSLAHMAKNGGRKTIWRGGYPLEIGADEDQGRQLKNAYNQA
ncbi:uncharacterized protein LOC119998535 [Tripterygium wilfordii]|uniref:uncharacterized protein LOC119998535 n=1 Tax=Tripterygium wilfordii TaxID=458696 RepID=UPI0018F8173A|nr:uncharacterized protein LOC119998535 [Tripterygium wilfordii]